VSLCANQSAEASQGFTQTGARADKGWGTHPLLVAGCRGRVPYAQRASLCNANAGAFVCTAADWARVRQRVELPTNESHFVPETHFWV
jgi:hypothetical protein